MIVKVILELTKTGQNKMEEESPSDYIIVLWLLGILKIIFLKNSKQLLDTSGMLLAYSRSSLATPRIEEGTVA